MFFLNSHRYPNPKLGNMWRQRIALNSGNTVPVPIHATIPLRGYYNGRYRDKNKLEIQAELRQHRHIRPPYMSGLQGA